MQKYICNLLILGLGASSTCLFTPCHAETAVKSNSQSTDNTSSISSDSPSTIKLRDLANSTDSKPTIVSDAVNNSSASSPKITTTKPKLRVPIFSRIFPTSSMQQ
ncbi:hypothetical protein [Nostoc sp. C117]|uniref:hypothetical protein n=1 Tax=Nostoc sp. C117 TaxID=3349875 RepID=UPI00370D7AF5